MNKAQTLEFLRTRLRGVRILPQYQIKLSSFKLQTDLVNSVQERLSGANRFVVRSSYSEEDKSSLSLAGKFTSLVNVTSLELVNAVETVFSSYPNLNENEIVFIQPYLEDTVRSGVVFSHIPMSGQPYLVDNYVVSADTKAITSGAGQGFRHICLRPKFKVNEELCNSVICMQLRELVEDCINILRVPAVDIEYAISKYQELYVFQARSLVTGERSNISLDTCLSESNNFLSRNIRKHPFVSGKRTIYGVMPDWNPAEIIGRRPKRLALSLYRELITDSIWAYQRDNYGYKNLRSFPLLVEINHHPYIDTRVSFNSLLPKGLDPELEEKLVNFYLDKLENNRSYHDKIEFEIVLSSWTFDVESKLKSLPENFTSDERLFLRDKLRALTMDIVQGEKLREDISRIQNLENRKRIISNEKQDRLTNLYWLLEDCKRWGTLPFAGLARAAFVATQIIKSLEKVSGIENILGNFIKGLNTITTQMQCDIANLSKKEFLIKYGHLRPGTYDITSKTYSEAYDVYFGHESTSSRVMRLEKRTTDLLKLLHSYSLIEKLGVSAEKFVQFATSAIYWREQSKFEFTKNLSAILDLVSDLGFEVGFTREELAFVDIFDLKQAYFTSMNLYDCLAKSIEKGKVQWERAKNIELPSLITSEADLYSFTEQDALANYVSFKKVSGRPNSGLNDIAGTIVLIESADPGFDWIFQHNILALVTAWGGANSHMSIRCSELNIPAVIGIGERLFEELKHARIIHIDCGNRIVQYQ